MTSQCLQLVYNLFKFYSEYIFVFVRSKLINSMTQRLDVIFCRMVMLKAAWKIPFIGSVSSRHDVTPQSSEQQTIKEQAQWKVEPQIIRWTAIYDTKPDIPKAFVFTNTTLYSQVHGIWRGMCARMTNVF